MSANVAYYKGASFTQEALSNEKTSELLKVYNTVATSAKLPQVARFSDHKSAVRRTWDMLVSHGGGPRQAAKTGGRRVRQKRFNYIAVGAPRTRRPETAERPVLRDRIATALERPEGMTFNQAVDIVKQFDADTKSAGKKIRNNGKTVDIRAYEAIRLVHTYLNLSLKQDEPCGDATPIHIIPNRKA